MTDEKTTTTEPPRIPENPEPDQIETWALANPERAKALGLRLIENQDAETLRTLESLGEDEDHAVEWAIEHPFKARMLLLGLLPKIKDALDAAAD